MSKLSFKEINDRIILAGRLKLRPICVYGSETVPEGAVQVASVITRGHKCLGKALLKMAMHEEVPPVYLGKDVLKGACFGASSWLGIIKMPPMMKDIYASVSKGDGNHNASFLKASPELCQQSLDRIGKITPPGKYIVMQALSQVDDDVAVRSILCFGNAEQIRNLCGLIHFNTAEPFSPVIAAWGAHCTTFVTYPAGMAEHAPKNTAFISPMASYGNDWFPTDLMALGIPIDMARRMAESYEYSFAVQKPAVTYADPKEVL